jgi:hypothetical protein
MQPEIKWPPRPSFVPRLPLMPLAIDARGVVNGDVPCRGCSYNLRALHQDSRCPECGTPVGLSIRGDLLRFCDPHWLSRVWVGAIVSLLGIVALTALNCVWGPFGFFRPAQYGLGLVVGTVAAIGTWLLTSPDPAANESPKLVRARLIARIGLTVALMRYIFLVYRYSTLNPKITAMIGIALVFLGLARVIGEIARLYYLQQLALRLPDDKLATTARSLVWWYGGAMVAFTLPSVTISFISLTLKQPPMSLIYVFNVLYWVMRIATIALLITGVRYATLLGQFAIALRSQQREARKLWQSAK